MGKLCLKTFFFFFERHCTSLRSIRRRVHILAQCYRIRCLRNHGDDRDTWAALTKPALTVPYLRHIHTLCNEIRTLVPGMRSCFWYGSHPSEEHRNTMIGRMVRQAGSYVLSPPTPTTCSRALYPSTPSEQKQKLFQHHVLDNRWVGVGGE